MPGEPKLMLRRLSCFAAVFVLAALWFELCRFLSGEWSASEQYSYGWFVPFFAAFLFWLRWENRPPIGSSLSRSQAWFCAVVALSALLFLLPIRLFEIAAPDWRPIAWVHAVAVVSLTLALLYAAGGAAWVRHFAFPVMFILVAVPWLSAIETPLIQGLMRFVAASAAELATWFGIPTHLEGNVVRVAAGLVGINEACSGVRSLQTSIMIGLLFGELKRLMLGRRIVLLAIAIFIALVANVGRALLLVIVAAQNGIPAAERWHDLTGYSIVVLVFGGSFAVATWLANASGSDRDPSDLAVVAPTAKTSPMRIAPAAAWAALCWILLVEVGAETWYRQHDRQIVPAARWSVQWPSDAPKFREAPVEESIRDALRFDDGKTATWEIQLAPPLAKSGTYRTALPESAIFCAAYFFRWDAGRSSILRARAHRPDICLPSVGWQQRDDYGARTFAANGVTLPFRHFTFARQNIPATPAQFADTYFCTTEDTMKGSTADSATATELTEMRGWRLVPYICRLVANGERPHAQQVMEVIFVGTAELSKDDGEQLFAALLPKLVAPATVP